MGKPRGFGPVAIPWHETDDEDTAALVAELNEEGEREMEREGRDHTYG